MTHLFRLPVPLMTLVRPLALYVFAALCGVVAPELAQQGLSKQTRELFDRVDQLGFERPGGKPFVRIRTGESEVADGAGRVDEGREGFLLSERCHESYGRTNFNG
jgi:hypothetical protein